MTFLLDLSRPSYFSFFSASRTGATDSKRLGNSRRSALMTVSHYDQAPAGNLGLGKARADANNSQPDWRFD